MQCTKHSPRRAFTRDRGFAAPVAQLVLGELDEVGCLLLVGHAPVRLLHGFHQLGGLGGVHRLVVDRVALIEVEISFSYGLVV